MDEQYIKEQFIKVIQHSQGIANPQVDELFNEWHKNKSWFLSQNGGEPIYEYPEPVSFELSEDDKLDKVDNFTNLIANNYGYESLAQFIDQMRGCFFSNITDRDFVTIHGTRIRKGTKIVRAFKYFVDNKSIRTDLQNKASRLIQEDKITGTLCISVHPLDFLSSSENDHNWRSCHALDGEYRAGNLSYMVDEGTVMVYLRSDKDTYLPNFPRNVKWNSKKWRVLLFFSNDFNMLFLGRQYPFNTDVGPEVITKTLLPKINLPGWTEWTNVYIDEIHMGKNIVHYLDYKYIPVGNRLISRTKLIEEGYQSLNYNDLLHSSCYTSPMYCYRDYRKIDDEDAIFYYHPQYGTTRTHFVIGGPVTCLHCGHNTVTLPETMLCSDCELEYGHLDNDDYGYCACCGQHFFIDDGLWLDELEGYVCPTCASSRFAECDNCGALTLDDELIHNEELGNICPVCQLRYTRANQTEEVNMVF